MIGEAEMDEIRKSLDEHQKLSDGVDFIEGLQIAIKHLNKCLVDAYWSPIAPVYANLRVKQMSNPNTKA